MSVQLVSKDTIDLLVTAVTAVSGDRTDRQPLAWPAVDPVDISGQRFPVRLRASRQRSIGLGDREQRPVISRYAFSDDPLLAKTDLGRELWWYNHEARIHRYPQHIRPEDYKYLDYEYVEYPGMNLSRPEVASRVLGAVNGFEYQINGMPRYAEMEVHGFVQALRKAIVESVDPTEQWQPQGWVVEAGNRNELLHLDADDATASSVITIRPTTAPAQPPGSRPSGRGR
jgi:hypothetical protein